MPSSCCAPGCAKRIEKGGDVKMYRLPLSDKSRLDKWIVKIKRLPALGQKSTRSDGLWEPREHDRLCNCHFVTGKPSKDPQHVDFVPSIFQHTPLVKKTPQVLQEKLQRQTRLVNREDRKTKSAAALALLQLSSNCENIVPGVGTQTVSRTVDNSTQTDLDCVNINEMSNLCSSQNETITKQESLINKLLGCLKTIQEHFNVLFAKSLELQDQIKELETASASLRVKVNTCLSYEFIKESDDRTSFYTGLPNYATFLVVFKHAKTHVVRKKTKLEPMDEMLLTLVKLRLNPGTQDLAFRFGISQTLVSRIFHAWLDAFYKSLGGLVIWPPIDKEIQLPEVFNNSQFMKVRCIIDCTEIFIERPTSLGARSQTYSNYKRHNTIKVLIGISPSGSVIFISEIWGGRASDKKITLESGILDKFVPGDVVMADRGFLLEEQFAMRSVKLITPSFTKGKSQLSPAEVELSRQMSRARIHVERVIGRLKDFQVLGGTMPIAFVKRKYTCLKSVYSVAGIVNINEPLL